MVFTSKSARMMRRKEAGKQRFERALEQLQRSQREEIDAPDVAENNNADVIEHKST
jgi:hypothetical protein